MNISDNDLIEVQAILETIPFEHPLKFQDLMKNWIFVVDRLRTPYYQDISTYVEDLSYRVIIQMVIDQVNTDLADYISGHVHIIDTMFLETTTPVAKSIVFITGQKTETDVMLYHRVPKVLSEAFKAELQSEDVI